MYFQMISCEQPNSLECGQMQTKLRQVRPAGVLLLTSSDLLEKVLSADGSKVCDMEYGALRVQGASFRPEVRMVVGPEYKRQVIRS
jgi:hypothetical protein